MLRTLAAAALAALFALPATSLPAVAHEGVHVVDPYARVIGPAGAVYFRIVNHEMVADNLISATSPDAGMVMLMNNHEDANGVMKMDMVSDGFPVGPEDNHLLAGGGDHVMLMSLTRKIEAGDMVSLTLTFARAGVVTLTVPVDNKRTEAPGFGPTAFDASSGE